MIFPPNVFNQTKQSLKEKYDAGVPILELLFASSNLWT